MKAFLIALLMSTAATAHAQTLSVEATVGSTFSNDDISYGLGVALDAPLNDVLNIGVEGAVEDFMDDGTPTTLYGGLVLSANLRPGTALYGSAGYVNRDGNDGYRLGTGLEQNLTARTYVRAGYEYTDFGNSVNSHGGTVGLGLRF